MTEDAQHREEDKMTCRILLLFILFILTSCVCGSFVVNVTQSSYQAEENHSITLEWSFTTNTGHAPNPLHVFCQKLTDVKGFVLLHVHDRVEVPESQDEDFAGRVKWDKDVLGEGRVRLHVSRLRTADSGLYLCDVYTRYGTNSGECRLNVSAARDRPEPETKDSPTERPKTESRGWIILYVGLGGTAAALLALLLIIMIIIYTGKTKKPMAGVQVLKKQPIRTHRSLSGGLY